ncbi:MAG: DUF421 domain-containing protein [Ruminococcus sp.]|jgi:uncharacterized membrane protein YcaP (DUF421 family)|nr:DUF421 domain-containing protein [Ruminococcus sp.]
MLIAFVRSLLLYIIVIFAVRLMGKRQIGELQPSELVVTMLVSNIATLPLEDQTTPLSLGVIAILSLVCFDVIMSYFTLKSSKFRKIVTGTPKVIIENGQVRRDTMNELRFSDDDLISAVRSAGVFDLKDVKFAIVETNGSVSVEENQPQSGGQSGDSSQQSQSGGQNGNPSQSESDSQNNSNSGSQNQSQSDNQSQSKSSKGSTGNKKKKGGK